jgi:rubrerythrin
VINTIRQYQAKTRKAFLTANRIEQMVKEVEFFLKDENDELTSLKKDLNKSIKNKPNGIQAEGLRLLNEIEKLRTGSLSKYIKAPETKKTTKSKK